MKIDHELILRLESLARIELSPDERTRTEKDLQDILTYMDSLSAVDTRDIQLQGLPGEVVNVLREDTCIPSPGPEVVLADAPESKDNQFKAPKTFE